MKGLPRVRGGIASQCLRGGAASGQYSLIGGGPGALRRLRDDDASGALFSGDGEDQWKSEGRSTDHKAFERGPRRITTLNLFKCSSLAATGPGRRTRR